MWLVNHCWEQFQKGRDKHVKLIITINVLLIVIIEPWTKCCEPTEMDQLCWRLSGKSQRGSNEQAESWRMTRSWLARNGKKSCGWERRARETWKTVFGKWIIVHGWSVRLGPRMPYFYEGWKQEMESGKGRGWWHCRTATLLWVKYRLWNDFAFTLGNIAGGGCSCLRNKEWE